MVFLSSVGFLDREWTERAACKNADEKLKRSFFSVVQSQNNYSPLETIKVQRITAEKALKTCKTCPVKRECRENHRHEVNYVWFGTVPAERDITVRLKRHLNTLDCMCYPCKIRKVVSTDRRKVAGLNARDRRIEEIRREEGRIEEGRIEGEG